MNQAVRNGIALSLTGSGHLLIYQLGACRILLNNKIIGDLIHHVAGASGGAIAATIVTKRPSLLDDFALEFIKTRGRGVSLLTEALEDSSQKSNNTISLHIGTTRCHDGQCHLFSFPSEEKEIRDPEFLLRCIEASCRIPPSFHPWDIFSSQVSGYPDQEGVFIQSSNHEDAIAYVDGGIATPAPPNPPGFFRLVISPVSGGMEIGDNHGRISPSDSSFSVGSLEGKVDFPVKLSLQNLRALRASAGTTTSGELHDWYQRGQEDADKFVNKCFEQN